MYKKYKITKSLQQLSQPNKLSCTMFSMMLSLCRSLKNKAALTWVSRPMLTLCMNVQTMSHHEHLITTGILKHLLTTMMQLMLLQWRWVQKPFDTMSTLQSWGMWSNMQLHPRMQNCGVSTMLTKHISDSVHIRPMCCQCWSIVVSFSAHITLVIPRHRMNLL